MLLIYTSAVVTLCVEVNNVMALWSADLLSIYNQTVCAYDGS